MAAILVLAAFLVPLLGLVDGQRRLRVWNSCKKAPIWIAHEAAGGAVGPGPQNVKIQAGKSYEFDTPDGLTGTRFWPKMFCDGEGNNCLLGGSGGPKQSCVLPNNDYSRCAPPIDTKFEATFGHSGQPCSGTSQAGCDFIDISLVDGFTLPVKLTMWGGQCTGGKGVHSQLIDCSGLTFDTCPSKDLGTLSADLRARNPKSGKVSGCYSPCTKLTDGKWNNSVVKGDPLIKPYCCPPGVAPEQCRQGAISYAKYVAAIHAHCPGVYAYSYDDAMGLLQCDASTHYELNFYCPAEMQSRSAVSGSESKKTAGNCSKYGCGGFEPMHDCQCNDACTVFNSCCDDFREKCGPGHNKSNQVSNKAGHRDARHGHTDQHRRAHKGTKHKHEKDIIDGTINVGNLQKKDAQSSSSSSAGSGSVSSSASLLSSSEGGNNLLARFRGSSHVLLPIFLGLVSLSVAAGLAVLGRLRKTRTSFLEGAPSASDGSDDQTSRDLLLPS